MLKRPPSVHSFIFSTYCAFRRYGLTASAALYYAKVSFNSYKQKRKEVSFV